MVKFNLFKKRKVEFDYIKFLNEVARDGRRKHVITADELMELFLCKVDKKKYTISLKEQLPTTVFGPYNWELYINERNKNQTVIINSSYMTEYQLYSSLYMLVGGNNEE